MKETINLRFDKEVVDAAKNYAKRNKTSVSKLVEDYFRQLISSRKDQYLSEQLEGCLKQYKNFSDEQIYKEYLKGKFDV